MSTALPPATRSEPACLAAVMRASASEIYLIDARTLRLLDASAAACANLQYDLASLLARPRLALAPAARAPLMRALAALPDDGEAGVETRCRRRDGSSYRLALRLRRAGAVIVAVGEPPRAGADEYQARFEAIVSNTPGLVYQFRLEADGGVAFPYLSEGCQPLLGLSAARLRQAPRLFLDLILAEDRKSYLDSMQASRAALSGWNWEGRIWIDAWKDVKWINLRATPHAQAGAVQWDGVMSNISASRLAQLELTQSRARLAELGAHSDSVRERERARIAREIHDDLGGNLTAIKMALAMLTRRLAPGEQAVLDKAAYVDALVDRTIDAVHRIALDLRPPVLDLGLVAALEWQVREFERQAGLVCGFTSNCREIALPPAHATALFRIAQEALTNIARHARASRVTVRLARLRHHISLKITDNGGGIWQADRAKPDSFGLRGMAERAHALGGALTLGHAAGGGTVVTIKIRLAAPRQTIIAADAGSGTGAFI